MLAKLTPRGFSQTLFGKIYPLVLLSIEVIHPIKKLSLSNGLVFVKVKEKIVG
jgi:hypothetical protein